MENQKRLQKRSNIWTVGWLWYSCSTGLGRLSSAKRLRLDWCSAEWWGSSFLLGFWRISSDTEAFKTHFLLQSLLKIKAETNIALYTLRHRTLSLCWLPLNGFGKSRTVIDSTRPCVKSIYARQDAKPSASVLSKLRSGNIQVNYINFIALSQSIVFSSHTEETSIR